MLNFQTSITSPFDLTDRETKSQDKWFANSSISENIQPEYLNILSCLKTGFIALHSGYHPGLLNQNSQKVCESTCITSASGDLWSDTLGSSILHCSAADFNKDWPIKNYRTLNKHHNVWVVKDLSQNIPEVRKPGFQVPNLLGQLPLVQAMPYSCLTIVIQETHRAWNVSCPSFWALLAFAVFPVNT